MMSVTTQLVQLLKDYRKEIKPDITPSDVEDLVLQFLQVFTAKPYNIEEVSLLYEEFRDFTRYILHLGYFTIADSNSTLARITKIFYPFNYRDNRMDRALKGLHLLYDSYDKENFSETLTSDINPQELLAAVKMLTDILARLKKDDVKLIIQDAIHKAILGMKIGFGNTSKNVEEDLQNYLKVAGLLGYYTPGTESEDAFLTQCTILSGVAESNGYVNEPLVSESDIELAKKYKGETSLFGGE